MCGLKHVHAAFIKCSNQGHILNHLLPCKPLIYSPALQTCQIKLCLQLLLVQMLHRYSGTSVTPQHLALSGKSEECLYICFSYHSSLMANRLFFFTNCLCFRAPATYHSLTHTLIYTVAFDSSVVIAMRQKYVTVGIQTCVKK